MKDKIICHNLRGEEFPVESGKFKFRPSVYGLLIENGKILLSKQWGGYDFPGGGMEIDETIGETIIREFWEETGLKVKPGRVLHAETSFYRPHHDDKEGKEIYWNCQLIFLAVERVSGELSVSNVDEFEQGYLELPEWIDVDSLSGREFKNSLGSRSADLIKKTALNEPYHIETL